MKRPVNLIFTLLLSLLLVNCGSDDVTPSYILTLKVAYPDGFTAANFPGDVTVTATNTSSTLTTSMVANANGEAIFELVVGTYNFTTSFSVTGDDDEEYSFNGVISNYTLIAESSVNMNLIMVDNTGGFVLKEIYYAGSKTVDEKSYYSDQFHEIYNNSGDTLYADGLCLAVMDPSLSSTPSVWVNEDGSLMDRLPLIFHVWRIPGDGNDHPVLPGESVLIAQDGIDHKTDENGNPNSPVNLGNADWEAYVEAAGKDLDASNVPNLTLVYTTTTTSFDWLAPVSGPAEVLFRLPDDWEAYASDANNFMTKPGSTSSTEYMLIDREFVIDAVECIRVDKPEFYKRVPNELDAGYTFLDGNSYCAKSVRRKAKMIIDGRVIYKDTNNSSEDFLHDLDPTPGINPTTVEN